MPLADGGGGAGVDVDVDDVALVGGGDEHVLAGVVAADDGRGGATRVGHYKFNLLKPSGIFLDHAEAET